MFAFLKRGVLLKDSGLFDGFTDWHSHLLPGVDDGIREAEESQEILKEYSGLGVRTVWLTPHVMEDYPNTPESLRERFGELLQTISAEPSGAKADAGDVALRLASENMMDNLLEERIDTGMLLPLGDDGDRLLVETSYYNPPMDMRRTLSRVRSSGFFPVLAHPERYLYMEQKEYARLKSEGVLFQLNIPSLIGFYGEAVKKKAEYILGKGWYDLSGLDLHSLKALRRILSTEIPNKQLERLQHIVNH
ncbi:MAG: tyrosine-protein phosphatase [Candidatus Cryptobacteroides sp.]